MINFFKSGTAERQKPAKETPDSPEGVQRLGSRELLEKEYSDVAEMANEVLVIIQLNRFNHLNTIFGMEMIETIVKILSGLCRAFGGEGVLAADGPDRGDNAVRRA